MFLLLNKYLTTYTNFLPLPLSSRTLSLSLFLFLPMPFDDMLPTRFSQLQVPPTAAAAAGGGNNVLMCVTFRQNCATDWLTDGVTDWMSDSHPRSCQPVAGSDWLTDRQKDWLALAQLAWREGKMPNSGGKISVSQNVLKRIVVAL